MEKKVTWAESIIVALIFLVFIGWPLEWILFQIAIRLFP